MITTLTLSGSVGKMGANRTRAQGTRQSGAGQSFATALAGTR